MSHSSDHKRQIFVIGGPTASGKTSLALRIAAEKNGEVINGDSMQIYDGLPIITAQPSAEERATCPHHLYGVRDPNLPCSAGDWRELAEPLIADILEREKTPIIVGGSGLYLLALMQGLAPVPDTPPDIRKNAMALLEEMGNPAFHAALQERDPIMAERLDPSNTMRLVRAWEVLEHTGKSLAVWQEMPRQAPPENWHFTAIIFIPPRDLLYDRCNRRFGMMLDQGGWDEIKAFDTAVNDGKVNEDAALGKALGVRPLRRFLHGNMTEAAAIEKAQAETRQYAKRQVTWFRHQIKETPTIRRVDLENADDLGKILP